MTTKQYVKKYGLDISNKFNHKDFCQDLTSEFIALLEYNKANDNLKGFDNAVRCIKMKFDAISNKTLGVFPEKLWNYFFATTIAPIREELCPKDMEARRLKQQRKKEEWEARKAYEERMYNFWDSDFFNSFFKLSIEAPPTDEFTILGLYDTANEYQIIEAYRELVMVHHPDKGGKQEKFIELTDAKNKCLSWLRSKNN